MFHLFIHNRFILTDGSMHINVHCYRCGYMHMISEIWISCLHYGTIFVDELTLDAFFISSFITNSPLTFILTDGSMHYQCLLFYRCERMQGQGCLQLSRVQMQEYLGKLWVQLQWQFIVHARTWRLYKWVFFWMLLLSFFDVRILVRKK